jgi:hypothetical protein
MTFKDLALELDAQQSPVQAAWAYEIAIKKSDADLELFLNLAVLYFECLDFGYAAHHKLSDRFVQGAGLRILEVIKEAEDRFGPHSELDFWRLYFNYIYGGCEPFDNECEELVVRGDSLVPYVYLFTSSGKKHYQQKAEELLELVKDGLTERKRYIKSLLS